MATVVCRCRICLTSFNSQTSKTPCYVQGSQQNLVYKLSYCLLCLKFRCDGIRGHPEINLNDAVKLANPDNYTIQPKITTLSCIQLESWQFKKLQIFPIGTIVFFRVFRINQLNITFSQTKRHMLDWKRVVWCIDRWDRPTSSRFAVGDDKKKGREGKERKGKVHKVTRRYILAILGRIPLGRFPQNLACVLHPAT